MTRLRIMSDLHLEFGPLDLEPCGEDVLILAGDIGVGLKGLAWATNYSLTYDIPVVLIAGNHEFYDGVPIQKRIMDLTHLAKPRVYFLNNSGKEVAGITFLGATLWTDYALQGDPAINRLIAQRHINDHRHIKSTHDKAFTPMDAAAAHEISVAYLRYAVAAPRTNPLVIITHHLPSAKSVDPQYDNDPLNTAFASNLGELVESSGATLWVHGHTHSSADYMIGNTHVICNPRGYVGYDVNPQFNPNLTVEVG